MADRYWVAGGSSGAWSAVGPTNWSATSGGPRGASVPTSADDVFFDTTTGFSVGVSGTLNFNNCTITASAIFLNGTTTAINCYGSMFRGTGTSVVFFGGNSVTFRSTSTATITSNGGQFAGTTIFNSATGSWALQDAAYFANVTLTAGTLDLNGKTATLTGIFNSSNSNARTIAFGTGNFVLGGLAGGTLWTTATVTGLTITGTPVVTIGTSGATASTVTPGLLSESQAISFNFTTGGYILSFLNSGHSAKNVDFTGFAGTWGATSTATIYGNLTISTGMTLTASVSAMTFGATSGTQLITTNGKTVNFPLTFNGVGGTFKLLDALTMGATRALTLTNGTFDGDSKTISGAASFNMVTGSATIKNVSTALAFTHTSGTLTLGTNITFTNVYTFTAGTLGLVSYSLTCTSFSTSNGNTRTIAFGTGNITINGSGNIWNNNAASGLTYTGTSNIIISNNTSNAVNLTIGGPTEANALSFNVINGTYALTCVGSLVTFKNLNFVSSGTTGFGGTISGQTANIRIYGDLTLSSNMTITSASTSGFTFLKTTGAQTVTSNGVVYNFPLSQDAVGGTVQLADALLMGASRAFTHTNGTLNLNGKTLTVGTTFTVAAGTKDITFNGGTLVCPASSTQAFNNANPTNFTTTAGTGTGKISMTGPSAKTFAGGGSTYNCTLSNDAAGALTISGSNTFTSIANGVQPTAFTFTAATTQTVTNWTVSGTAGNLVTIISSTAGVPALLSKASGTVSSNYLSLKDSTALGGAAWYAGANSTNVSGNSGWIFSNAPSNAAGSFFFMF